MTGDRSKRPTAGERSSRVDWRRQAPVRQGQKAVPRDGNDSALVPPPVERHHEVDRCLARTDQDYVIAAREGERAPPGPMDPARTGCSEKPSCSR